MACLRLFISIAFIIIAPSASVRRVMGSLSVFRVTLDQTSHSGSTTVLMASPLVADGRAEGNPRTDVAQRGHEHLKVGGEPSAILIRATQAGERVAQSCRREDATHHYRDDGEVRSQSREEVHIRRPSPEHLNRAGHHCRVRLHPSGGEGQKSAAAPQVPDRSPDGP